MTAKTAKLGRPLGSSAEKTREKLLRAAARQFNDHGYYYASMARIAAEAGMTGAAIYNHFESKDDLFVATIESFILNYNTMLTEAVLIEGDWKAKLKNVAKTIAKIRQSGPNFPLISSVVQSALKREPGKFERIRKLRGKSAEVFCGIVSDAIAAGDLPDTVDVGVTGELLMAFAIQGTNTVSNYHADDDASDKIVESFLALLRIA